MHVIYTHAHRANLTKSTIAILIIQKVESIHKWIKTLWWKFKLPRRYINFWNHMHTNIASKTRKQKLTEYKEIDKTTSIVGY